MHDLKNIVCTIKSRFGGVIVLMVIVVIGQLNTITCTCISEDKRWLVTGEKGRDAVVIVWDTYTGSVIFLITMLYCTVCCITQYVVLHSMLYCAVCCIAQYVVLHSMLYCTLCCVAQYVVICCLVLADKGYICKVVIYL